MLQKHPGIEQKAYRHNYIVLDIETTGLSPDKDEIVRISAIRVENEKEIDAFTSLVKPDNRIPQEVSKIIGITDDMVSDSPSIEEILPKLMKFIRHTVLVGYNISFDLKFLNRASKRYFDKYIGNNYIDVPELAKEFLTDMKSFRPENMAAHFGIEIEASPQGLSECRMTKSLYENICREISRQGRGTIEFRTRVEKEADHFYLVPSKYTYQNINAYEELERICKERVKELYGDTPNFEVRKRLERELDKIYRDGHAVFYMICRHLVKKALEEDRPRGFMGSIGASFVAFLCGITELNPLSPESGGYHIVEEDMLGLVTKNNPHAALLFTSDIEALVRVSIRGLPLSEEKCYSGELLPMPEEQSNVYPRSIYIGKNRYCDLLYAMQMRTGVKPEDIPLTDEGVLTLICDVNQKEIKNLPLFGSEDVREIISSTVPKTFDDLVKINGLCFGTRTWLDNQDELLETHQIALSDCISSRDDVMIYLMNMLIDKKTAYSIMESVRKGKGLTDEQKSIMIAAEIPEWYISVCEKIKYLFPKAHCVLFTLFAIRLAYYMIYYPKEYAEELDKYLSDEETRNLM